MTDTTTYSGSEVISTGDGDPSEVEGSQSISLDDYIAQSKYESLSPDDLDGQSDEGSSPGVNDTGGQVPANATTETVTGENGSEDATNGADTTTESQGLEPEPENTTADSPDPRDAAVEDMRNQLQAMQNQQRQRDVTAVRARVAQENQQFLNSLENMSPEEAALAKSNRSNMILKVQASYLQNQRNQEAQLRQQDNTNYQNTEQQRQMQAKMRLVDMQLAEHNLPDFVASALMTAGTPQEMVEMSAQYAGLVPKQVETPAPAPVQRTRQVDLGGGDYSTAGGRQPPQNGSGDLESLISGTNYQYSSS